MLNCTANNENSNNPSIIFNICVYIPTHYILLQSNIEDI